jgi:hypothetical protein
MYRRIGLMWRVDGNIPELYSVNEFAMSDVETSRFVIGIGIYSNKAVPMVPQCFGALLIVRIPPKAKWNSPDSLRPLRLAVG